MQFERLKGGGVITEIEGQKATQALARMKESQSTEQFIESLNQFKTILQDGLRRTERQINAGPISVDNFQGVDSQPAPNIPASAIQMLRENPDLAGAFNQKYGEGAAQRVLN